MARSRIDGSYRLAKSCISACTGPSSSGGGPRRRSTQRPRSCGNIVAITPAAKIAQVSADKIVNSSSSVYGVPAVTCGAISPCPVYRAIWWRSLLTSAGISTARSPTSHSHNHGGIICSPVA